VTAAEGASRVLLLSDSCCLLNLFATGHIEEILRALPWRFAIATAVAGETVWILRGGTGIDATERVAVDVMSLVSAGLLEIIGPTSDAEYEAYVQLAAVLDDGEAMTGSLAMHRGAAVATDDRKARREIAARAPDVRLVSTAELLCDWATLESVAAAVLAKALRDIRTRARFVPGAQDPLYGWWTAAAGESS
jgi:predicted nucleic acid-binding protein